MLSDYSEVATELIIAVTRHSTIHNAVMRHERAVTGMSAFCLLLVTPLDDVRGLCEGLVPFSLKTDRYMSLFPPSNFLF